jgi:hypothetical protein
VLALDEHDLSQRAGLFEAGLLEDLVGLVRLAGVAVGLVDLLQTGAHPEHDSGDHEREPAEDRGLAMARAPATHPGRQVV